MPYTQTNAFAAISSALGPDFLLLKSLRGVERMSSLFRFDLELLSERLPVDLTKLVGKAVSVRINLPNIEQPRYLHGYLSRVRLNRDRGPLTHYTAEMVPWLWFLTQTTDCRIYQKQSVTDIIEQVCKDHGFSDIQLDVDAGVKSTKLEYCVQYRETDFNFVSRLMEHYGISYYFLHKKDRHLLVLVNQPGSYPVCQGAGEPIRYLEDPRVSVGVITDLTLEQEVRPARTVLRDYNFEKPNATLEVAATGKAPAEYPKYEVYDYHPGYYRDRGPGDDLAERRLEEKEGTYRVIHGTGTFRGLAAGNQFAISEHPRPVLNGKYVALEVWHNVSVGGYEDNEKPEYDNRFIAVGVNTALRPERVTPRPTVQGPQTAVVVGEAGEEIYTDEHGRVKVQFHWDRQGKKDQDSSCWVRISQNWAGEKYGIFFLPRIGHEVIVDFLEGDPDRPILTGAVYNAHQKPPYDLPAERSKSTIKTNSYKGSGFNELRFEDKTGSEEVYLHAQKDVNGVVEHDYTMTVKAGDHTLTVKAGDQSVTVSGDITITASKSITFLCGASSIKLEPEQITILAPLVSSKADTNHTGLMTIQGETNITGALTVEGVTNITGALTVEGVIAGTTITGEIIPLPP